MSEQPEVTPLDVFKAEMNGFMAQVNSKLDVLLSGTGGNCRDHKAKMEAHEARIASLEDANKWLWRLVITTILGACLSTTVSVIIGFVLKGLLTQLFTTVIK